MKKITAVVIGFGNRGQIYSKFALKEPNLLSIVAVVEPNEIKRNCAKNLFKINEEQCFSNYDDFIAKGKIADCAINATMDNLHIKTTLPLLKLKYDVLLEKPISSEIEELELLQKTADENKCKVIVCHVLRYTPFYKKIKAELINETIGEVRHIETTENVGFAHASVSYVRGKWNNEEKCGSSYLMAKCCHDFDLLCWLNQKGEPQEAYSVGRKNMFIPSNAPIGGGNRCLVDCKVEKDCIFSCRKINLENNPIPDIVWENKNKLIENISYEEKVSELKTTNPHGKCIFKTDSDLVDQQMTFISFSNGVTAYHNLQSGVARAGRSIKIYGSKGEIEGFTEDNKYVVRTFNPDNISYNEREVVINENILGDNHYGGDSGIMYDLINVLNNNAPTISTTYLKDSINSHLCVIAADKSNKSHKSENIINIKAK